MERRASLAPQESGKLVRALKAAVQYVFGCPNGFTFGGGEFKAVGFASGGKAEIPRLAGSYLFGDGSGAEVVLHGGVLGQGAFLTGVNEGELHKAISDWGSMKSVVVVCRVLQVTPKALA